MNKDELNILREIQKEYLDEIRLREIKHTDELKQQEIKYMKEILRYRRIIKSILIIIIAFIFIWSIGYWIFGEGNNTAFINENTGNIVQQQIKNKGDR